MCQYSPSLSEVNLAVEMDFEIVGEDLRMNCSWKGENAVLQLWQDHRGQVSLILVTYCLIHVCLELDGVWGVDTVHVKNILYKIRSECMSACVRECVSE